jgi:hypothetical protein
MCRGSGNGKKPTRTGDVAAKNGRQDYMIGGFCNIFLCKQMRGTRGVDYMI